MPELNSFSQEAYRVQILFPRLPLIITRALSIERWHAVHRKHLLSRTAPSTPSASYEIFFYMFTPPIFSNTQKIEAQNRTNGCSYPGLSLSLPVGRRHSCHLAQRRLGLFYSTRFEALHCKCSHIGTSTQITTFLLRPPRRVAL